MNKGIGSGGPDHHRDIVLMDLRNHGESDHHKSMTYLEMAEDLIRFADAKHLEKLTLIGHNVGAKTAMMAAQMYPERIAGLISLDTAPVSSPPEARKGTMGVIDQLLSINLKGMTRKSAIDAVGQMFSDPGIANFVTNNIVYEGEDDE